MKSKITTLIVFILIITIWAIANFIKPNWLKVESANVLIAGLAFVGLMHSLNKQQETIDLQHEDLILQRDEMKLARSEMEFQNDTLRIQRFENTFFNMLQLHHQIVTQIDVQLYDKPEEDVPNFLRETKSYANRDAFEKLYYHLKEYYNKNSAKKQIGTNEARYDLDEINEIYLSFYDMYKTDLGHYFRNLYRIIKIIDTTKFDEDVIKNFQIKYSYTSIVRSQLSDYELLLLFYNCLSENGVELFKPYTEKFTLFKNLPISELYHTHFAYLYARTCKEKPQDLRSHLIRYDLKLKA